MMSERGRNEWMSEMIARKSNPLSPFPPSLPMHLKPFVSLKYFRCMVVRFDSGNCSPVSLNSLVMLPPSHAVLGMMIWEGGREGGKGGRREYRGHEKHNQSIGTLWYSIVEHSMA